MTTYRSSFLLTHWLVCDTTYKSCVTLFFFLLCRLKFQRTGKKFPPVYINLNRIQRYLLLIWLQTYRTIWSNGIELPGRRNFQWLLGRAYEDLDSPFHFRWELHVAYFSSVLAGHIGPLDYTNMSPLGAGLGTDGTFNPSTSICPTNQNDRWVL